MKPGDRELGMDRRITRRDFLDGMALAVGGTLIVPGWARGLETGGGPARYPPALTGLRGSHDGSWEVAHALRDGSFWASAGEATATGEEYDLVVVGAGISGLAAAYYYRQAAGPSARVLLLDNHDDFGGHARRNEFRLGRRTLVGFGGTYAIDSPAPYSAEARKLVADLGIDVSRYAKVKDGRLFPSLGLGRAVFFDRETFGADRLLPAPAEEDGAAWKSFLAAAPLSEAARRDVARLLFEKVDHFPGLSSARKKERLARISYASFLTTVAGLDDGVVTFLQGRPHGLYGMGIDGVSAQDAWGLGFPGFAGLGLEPGPGPGQGLDAIRHKEAGGAYFFHFPDGNASLARLLVRALVPAAVPGRTADDVVTARTDYGRLDVVGAPVRVRLESTVVRVAHDGPESEAREVEVQYARGGRLVSVRGRRCVLACWHGVVPYICPELPAGQKDALAQATKVPLVYTSVLLRDWKALSALGVAEVYAPGAYYGSMELNAPVSIGSYRAPRSPSDPIVVHLDRSPCLPGRPAREQHRAGRLELLTTTFEEFERRTRDQLARMFEKGGFDPGRDVAAITVNRWPHGYAYQYNSLWDPFWLEGGPTPCEVARRPFGRIAIANADAGAYSYTDAAIDHAHRAVRELPR
ncbi:MAG TPA: FAD-dependent oxidoreductase [Vicinamibacteria bacterium]|nr:FAD-dependent oxidoreductase [Vicinamibacteria bacterium]